MENTNAVNNSIEVELETNTVETNTKPKINKEPVSSVVEENKVEDKKQIIKEEKRDSKDSKKSKKSSNKSVGSNKIIIQKQSPKGQQINQICLYA